jgi:hypothetical protein
METLFDPQLVSRIKSLIWRTGMMGLAVAIDSAIAGLSDLQMSSAVTVILGLLLGELSKYLNRKAV